MRTCAFNLAVPAVSSDNRVIESSVHEYLRRASQRRFPRSSSSLRARHLSSSSRIAIIGSLKRSYRRIRVLSIGVARSKLKAHVVLCLFDLPRVAFVRVEGFVFGFVHFKPCLDREFTFYMDENCSISKLRIRNRSRQASGLESFVFRKCTNRFMQVSCKVLHGESQTENRSFRT